MFEGSYSARNALPELATETGAGSSRAKPQDAGSAPPHICFVAPEAWPVFSGSTEINVVGGAEVQQSILARGLARAGYRVSMICLNYGQPAQVKIDGVTIYRAHAHDAGMPGLRFIHPRLTGMWKAMQAADADIYYQRTTSMLTALVAAFCRRHGKRSIYAGASDTDFVPGHQIIRYRRDRWLFELGLAWVDRLAVQNQTQQQDCLHHYERQSVVIPSCYQLPEDARLGQGRNILWVGNLHRNKRPELFLEAAQNLPQFRFVMVGGPGNGPGDRNYFERIRHRALSLPNVEFVGYLPLKQVESCFDQAAIFINTSVYEGMPNTFLQAWARGIPTLALIDVGARYEGEPVYPVAAGLADMTEEIKRLFADETHYQQVSRRCREYFAAHHSPARALALYEQLFAELLTCDARP